MSMSFAKWRRAGRIGFEADLRALRQRGWKGRRRGSRLRLWRSGELALLGFAALAGIAMAFTIDQFEHEPREPRQVEADRSSVVRPAFAAVRVVDGDTLKFGNERIRLHGIDAPESLQRCADGWQAGQAARRELAELVSKGTPNCERVTTDRYGRTVAICRVNGLDISAAMVRRGLAWAYTKYSVRYVPEEALARVEGVGVHARTCTQPAEWRQQNRR
jgi:endonuclease YncB( thermonuclease family)